MDDARKALTMGRRDFTHGSCARGGHSPRGTNLVSTQTKLAGNTLKRTPEPIEQRAWGRDTTERCESGGAALFEIAPHGSATSRRCDLERPRYSRSDDHIVGAAVEVVDAQSRWYGSTPSTLFPPVLLRTG